MIFRTCGGPYPFLGAFEKQKFAYMISRDSKAKLKITSPLESNASYTIFFALCALDTGFENPLFAVIEADYSTADEQVLEEDEAEFMTKKVLVYYELDLGLNNILRKYSVPLDITAHKLVPGNPMWSIVMRLCLTLSA